MTLEHIVLPNRPAPEHPNLVFVLPDRLRQDSMARYGNDWIQSPHMNALAERSLVFENAYVTQPVCAPARSSIMTGLYPQAHGLSTNGIPLRPETRTIAEMVSEEYLCGYYGKWHLGDELRPQHGFDRWLGRETARFIRENRHRPFVLYVNFLEPHMPYDGPLNDMYPRNQLNTGP